MFYFGFECCDCIVSIMDLQHGLRVYLSTIIRVWMLKHIASKNNLCFFMWIVGKFNVLEYLLQFNRVYCDCMQITQIMSNIKHEFHSFAHRKTIETVVNQKGRKKNIAKNLFIIYKVAIFCNIAKHEDRVMAVGWI